MKDPDVQLSLIENSVVPTRTGRMLISKERQRYVEIDADKVSRGSFHTKGDCWLVAPVVNFIREALESGFAGCLDPFAGAGDLLAQCGERFDCATHGLDLIGGKWPVNDSLRLIPSGTGMLIVTNPPYLAKYSASRKGVISEASCYFNASDWEDLYQIALDRCLEASNRVVAIIPETFINSSYPKRHVELVSVLEDNPFHCRPTDWARRALSLDFARL